MGREYESREEAEHDLELDLHYIFRCCGCQHEMELRPQEVPVTCGRCGGEMIETGESYNSIR